MGKVKTNDADNIVPPQKSPTAQERVEEEPNPGKRKDDTDESDRSRYMPK